MYCSLAYGQKGFEEEHPIHCTVLPCVSVFRIDLSSESIDNPYFKITIDSHKSQVQGSFKCIIERVEIVEYSMCWNSSFY